MWVKGGLQDRMLAAITDAEDVAEKTLVISSKDGANQKTIVASVQQAVTITLRVVITSTASTGVMLLAPALQVLSLGMLVLLSSSILPIPADWLPTSVFGWDTQIIKTLIHALNYCTTSDGTVDTSLELLKGVSSFIVWVCATTWSISATLHLIFSETM
jgi:hypothetical protein